MLNKQRWSVLFTFLVILFGTNGLYAEASANPSEPKEQHEMIAESENEIEIQKSSIFFNGILSLFFADKEPEDEIEKEEVEEDSVEEKEEPEADEADTSKEEKKEEPESEEPEEDDSKTFVLPAEGRMSSPYGYRIHPIQKTEKLHAGMDIAGGGPIVAAQSGTVTRARYHEGWGWYVKIDHGEGLETLYAHMQTDSLKVKEGDTVSQDQEIGTMGTTGSSTGVHLHFEVYVDDTQVDPAEFLEL